MEKYEKVEAVLSHIQNVQRNCYKLGLKLIKSGQFELGRNLIANGQMHDNSKFKGVEFEELFSDSNILESAVRHHNSTNPHHPQYWGGIKNMPDVFIAEMACDLTARSQEFGTDVRQWIVSEATVRYSFNMEDEVAKKLNYYIDMLLEKPFK